MNWHWFEEFILKLGISFKLSTVTTASFRMMYIIQLYISDVQEDML